jgi:hypothetical protein
LAAVLFFGGKWFFKRGDDVVSRLRDGTPKVSRSVETGDTIRGLFDKKVSGRIVTGKGRVVHLLSDDLQGSRHQRFLVQLQNGITLKLAHNIDLAKRVPLREGDEVSFKGQYEWNEKGGVVHWTHHDPAGRHTGGWIRHNSRLFQ